MKNYIGLFLCSALTAYVVGCSPQMGAPEKAMPEEGSPAQDFAIPDLKADGEIKLADYKGQVVLLDFWATWCPPCRAELPELSMLYQELKPKGFALIGMTVDQDEQAVVASAVKKFNLSYPVGFAGPDVQARYGDIRAVPTKFLLDKRGAVRQHYVGVVKLQVLRSDIEKLLAE